MLRPRTRQFSGAEIRNVCNLAALNAVTTDQLYVEMANFDVAIDKVKRKSGRLKERLRQDKAMWDRAATQKVGKAVVDALLKINSVHKVELLDLASHFELGETGSFKGIKLKMDKPVKSWKDAYSAPFVERFDTDSSGR